MDERAAIVADIEGGHRLGDSAGDSGGAPDGPIARELPPWASPDLQWPVSLEALQRAVGKTTGFASYGEKQRKSSRLHAATDDHGIIAPGRLFYERFPCILRHPGLCYSKDEDVCDSALRLARSLENLCVPDKRGKYILVWAADEHGAALENGFRIVLCWLGPSDLPGWARCWFVENEESPGHFEWESVWSVAKLALRHHHPQGLPQ
eukprot:3995715-Pyramimonas_sp.AAC.1